MNFYRKTYGSSDGEPIVLLHGFGFHSDIWENFLPYLIKNNLAVTVIDLPGWGRSRGIPPWGPYLGGGYAGPPLQPATYVGWSLGGLFAMKIAEQYPTMVKHLVTIASTPKFIATSDWAGIDPIFFEKFCCSIQKNPRLALLKWRHLLCRKNYHDELSKFFTDEILPEQKTLIDYLHILATTDLRLVLPKLSVPQTHILGSEDLLIPIAKHTTHVIEQAEHMPFLTHPEQCAEILYEKIFYYRN